MSVRSVDLLSGLVAAALACGLQLVSATAAAAGPPDTAELLQAERKAIQPLDAFDGLWRGPAMVILPNGIEIRVVQTERVGAALDATIKIIEGRSYAPDGSSPFNAFAVMSYAPQTGQYTMHAHAQGYAGDFALQVRADGFSWSIPAGPATLRYTATVKDGVWREIGERLVEGQPPVKTFEMTLQRVGDTDWPAAGAVPRD